MEILKKLTRLFAVSSLLFITGCITLTIEKPPSAFPPSPKLLEYTQDPVLYFNEQDSTYIISSEYMQNSILNKMFLDQILKWKELNDL